MADFRLPLSMQRWAALPLLSREQEYALFVEYRVVIGARQQQIEAEVIGRNIRFVLRKIRAYEHLNVPFDDLLQEALIGMTRAMRKFDHRRGIRRARRGVQFCHAGL